MKAFPIQLTEYLFKETVPFNEVLILQTDVTGLVKDWFGPYEKYMEKEPTAKEFIFDLIPHLYGMVPPISNPMILPNMEMKPGSIADIHILTDELKDHWIVFINKAEDAEILQRFIQDHNEKALIKELAKKKHHASDLPFGMIDALDYVAFERNKEDSFTLRSDYPDWFMDIYSPVPKRMDSIDLAEQIPFIEYFIHEAEPVWGKHKNSRIVSIPYTETTSQGKEIYIQATALHLNNKNYLLLNKMGNDYTMQQSVIQKAREQKLIYERLKKTDLKLKQLLKFKDQFISIVSHDLRSPIASVISITNLFLNNKEQLNKFDDFHQSMLLSIHDELKRLLDYNSKLYHWSNLELGNFKLDLQEIEVQQLIGNTHQIYLDNIEEKQIHFENSVPEDIHIQADEPLLSQVFNNLIGNSIKFTPENGTISISAKESKNKMAICINDSGVGMTKENIEGIFSDSARESTIGTMGEKGTGLGLGIVKKIIDAHGFTIHVESEINKGTKFIIEIPKGN